MSDTTSSNNVHLVELSENILDSSDTHEVYKRAAEFLEMTKRFTGRFKKDDDDDEVTYHHEYLRMLTGAIPPKFGPIEPDTPVYDLLKSVAMTLDRLDGMWTDRFNSFDAKMEEYRNPISAIEAKFDAAINSYTYKIDREISGNMRRLVREELQKIFEIKSAAETAEFIQQLESL